MIYIANTDLQLALDAPATGNIAITNMPSIKNAAVGSSVWFEKISILLTNVTAGAITNGDGIGSGDILPTSEKVSENGGYVLRNDDSVTISCNGTAPNPSPPPTNIPASANVTVRIINPGQNKIDAN